MTTELRFRLNINREQALRYYQGAARVVVVTTTAGQKLQFPAEEIRALVDRDGIQGEFTIQFDENNKLIGLRRV